MDSKQFLAGVLTISMFLMLGNMIKRDHFDTVEARHRGEERSLNWVSRKPARTQALKPCWGKPEEDAEQSNGHITFSLKSGPEYHSSQVADAVVIARYLGATLVLPDIRGSKPGQKRNFQELYDVDKFIQSLEGVVKVVGELPAGVAARLPTVIRVPNGVSEDFINEQIRPAFLANNYLKLASSFPSASVGMRENRNDELESVACLAMFGSLVIKPAVSKVADMMIQRLQMLGHNLHSQFIAIDIRTDRKGCKEGKAGKKACYDVQEVVDFLRMLGFSKDNAVYVTQTWWDETLTPLKEYFPRTYTKDDLVPAEKRAEVLGTGSELERVIDFQICSKSDVFVPAVAGVFYESVAGKRIASGLTKILVPGQVDDDASAATADEFVSSYVSKKKHVAYSCHC
ncbi:protein MANNAN SYNTHESIS-RELATED 1-like [Zingiber officinale]|uniref:protein MANNAN SYNTHESIS-RELATED 1-like n=1 Tax=Zingiber officinale TaxID=94328 RepID=UPI001C4DD750|nr:protein MANNAN SYNTHESIS-RELATED 1-like [Zingiber officinale]